jgi:uncharacterized protein YciI
MLFAIRALDRAGALPTRLANYDAHKAFLSDASRFGISIVMSGPLVSDNGETMIGSLFLVDAWGRLEVETHLSLEKDAPISRAVELAGDILCRPILGGLHHQYVRI